jgi:very-short-patch-repair endonuclease
VLQGPAPTIERARTLRTSMSLPEVLLWRILRTRPGGLKFRRQHLAGRYIADFYCHEARLIVEIDGEAHNRGDRPERDIKRDTELAALGLKIVRIPAVQILQDVEAAAEAIVALALPLHHPAGGSPPHALHGEDFTGAP